MMHLLSAMLILMNIGINGNRYWENFSDTEKNMVLKSENVAKDAIKYYNGQFIASDDDATFELLDELTSKQLDAGIKALYFHLFNKILMSSDGALGEVLPGYVLKIILSDVPFVFDYFIEKYELMELFSIFLGWEFQTVTLFETPYTFDEF